MGTGMRISLSLLACTLTFAAGSCASAADAIVAATPEPMEYVRVCDAFGTGYFYMPGTNTCLRVGGQLRWEFRFNDHDDERNWNARIRGAVKVFTRTDTELGTLGSYVDMRSWAESDYANSKEEIGGATISLGEFKIGYDYNWWDTSMSGETDDIGSNRLMMAGFDHKRDDLEYGLYVEEVTKQYSESGQTYTGNDQVGLDGSLTYSVGPLKAWFLGGYDFHADAGTIRMITTVQAGPGQFEIGGLYSSGANAYYDLGKWSGALQYVARVTDKFQVIPGVQYWDQIGYNSDGDFGHGNAWRAGFTLNYRIVKGFDAKLTANWNRTTASDWAHENGWDGFLRLERNF
jgi:hypothetical protein